MPDLLIEETFPQKRRKEYNESYNEFKNATAALALRPGGVALAVDEKTGMKTRIYFDLSGYGF